ncbi:hypothetical protein BDZ94DRAFT_473689 [Collybia nuda]|uniref:Uncharacterized protein n=1 Tax=Collybia nuda TaxID=64659 RepID=A0A9P6CFU5_9AGAR|nr:hypothetical protein BDZ94DRAFT_473689 [Collybia nuda]
MDIQEIGGGFARDLMPTLKALVNIRMDVDLADQYQYLSTSSSMAVVTQCNNLRKSKTMPIGRFSPFFLLKETYIYRSTSLVFPTMMESRPIEGVQTDMLCDTGDVDKPYPFIKDFRAHEPTNRVVAYYMTFGRGQPLPLSFPIISFFIDQSGPITKVVYNGVEGACIIQPEPLRAIRCHY